jgi:hypothetical protein
MIEDASEDFSNIEEHITFNQNIANSSVKKTKQAVHDLNIIIV